MFTQPAVEQVISLGWCPSSVRPDLPRGRWNPDFADGYLLSWVDSLAKQRSAPASWREQSRRGSRKGIGERDTRDLVPGVQSEAFDASVGVPFRTQHPLGAVVNRPSVWSDR